MENINRKFVKVNGIALQKVRKRAVSGLLQIFPIVFHFNILYACMFQACFIGIIATLDSQSENSNLNVFRANTQNTMDLSR